MVDGLSSVENLSVAAFYIDVEEKKAEFPGASQTHPLATATRETRLLNVIFTLFYHLRFVWYLAVHRPDIVHLNTVFRNQYHTYGLTILGKLIGTRVVRTVHEVTAERLRNVSERETRIAYRHLRACDHLIVHSDNVETDLKSENVSTPITVLPHGNYLFFKEYLDPDAEPPLPVDDGPVVLFFGPKQHKGIDVFSEALTAVNTSFTTWIAGPISGDTMTPVLDIESLPKTYVDRGYIADEDLPAYFDHADIVVLPYHSGTTSGAVHLARAFETTVITSPLPCFINVVEHGVDGYILTENTPTALAKALDKLVSSPNMARGLAFAGLETERSPRFDWGRIARRTVDIYPGG